MRRGIAASFTAGLFIVWMVVVGCRNHVAAVHTDSKRPGAMGMVSGTVRGPQGTVAIDDRPVEVVNVETNERQRATTTGGGGFSFKLRPGKYRVELPLRAGEALIKEPGEINITDTAVDAHADFIVGAAPLSRPRGPAYRIFEGLGHPIA